MVQFAFEWTLFVDGAPFLCPSMSSVDCQAKILKKNLGKSMTLHQHQLRGAAIVV